MLTVACAPTCDLDEHYALIPPTPCGRPEDALILRITKALATRLNMSSRFAEVKRLISHAEIQQYSQLVIKGGDRVWAASMCPSAEGRRDATYVRVSTLF
jgi:hypothetical protein